MDEYMPGLTAWLDKVDAIFQSRLLLGRDYFPDWHWADSFEDGMTPEDAFEAYWEEYNE